MTQSPRLVSQVDTEIGEFLASRQPILLAIGAELTPFADFSRYLLSGGKRFRAQFCFWGWRATSDSAATAPQAAAGVADPEASAALLRLCAALEIFHAAALVHDDIIDNSATRRGMPSAHVRFESLHRESGFTGLPESFGRASAILLGDLLLGWSDELLDGALEDLPSRDAARAARAEFNRMRTEVTLGQYLDILEENAWPTVSDSDTVSRAERIMVYKSAKYSVEAPLALGALQGGAAPEQVAALRLFGLPLGIAFQLRDDVLGIFGDTAITGKPSGDDLREGKRTVIVALARESMTAAQRRDFDAALGDPALDDVHVVELQRIIQDSGALERVEALISDHTSAALSALHSAPLEPGPVIELERLTGILTQRQF